MLRFSLMLAAMLTVAACSNGTATVNANVERLVPVNVVLAEAGPGAAAIRTSAMLAHKDEMRLAFKIGGVIARINVDEGSLVKKGQILAELELAEVGSQVEQSRQMLVKAERDLKRGERLHAEQVIALEQLQDLRTQRDMAAQALKGTSFNREYAVITAPSDGVVLRKLGEARETVASGVTVLTLGSSDTGFVLKASLADRDVVQLALGDNAEVRFDAFPGEKFKAQVTRLPAAADARTGMFDVELSLEDTLARGKSGLVGRIALVPATAGAKQLSYVPIASIHEGDRGRATVFVFTRASETVHRRAVEVAFIDGDRVALGSGLEVGTEVVTDGAAYVEDGKKVRLSKR